MSQGINESHNTVNDLNNEAERLADNINESQETVDESNDEADRLVDEWKGHEDFPIFASREVQLGFIAEQIKRSRKADTPPAQVVKRRKAGCPIALETQRAEDGATHVQVIHPSEETPDLDRKLARLIDLHCSCKCILCGIAGS